jgi:glycosyltransferase involved in cell wall biosynthesis
VQIEQDTLAHHVRALDGEAGVAILVCHDPGPIIAGDQARVTTGRQRLAHRLDATLYRRYWNASLPDFDAIVTFSPDDQRAVQEGVPGARVVRIPLGIELPREPLDPVGAEPPSVCFVGGYRHPPNADAALRLMRTIMPLARERIPDLRFAAVGADPTEDMRRAATSLDEVTGAVERVEPWVDRAAVMALPIRLGGGMRVKLLEALGAGKAVVASARAAAGLEFPAVQPLRLAESDEEFAAAIVDLVEDPEARRELGRKARTWALEHLSWDARVAEYEALYRSLLPG